jgi:hypothetical protein
MNTASGPPALSDREEFYVFTTVKQMVADFLNDVDRKRSAK